MEEIWKDIKGYKGKYQVSNLGRVKSLNYRNTGKEKILSPGKYSGEYLQVMLYKDGKLKKHSIHRLVALAFIPNSNNYPIINHKDENPSNNRVDNLEWCTYKYNSNYGTCRQKISEHAKKRIGENNPFYGKKHSEETKKKMRENHADVKGGKHPEAKRVLCITTGEEFSCLREAGEKYNLKGYCHIGSCCRGKLKTYGKHPITGEKLIWEYVEE